MVQDAQLVVEEEEVSLEKNSLKEGYTITIQEAKYQANYDRTYP